jgi:hypothetical protein
MTDHDDAAHRTGESDGGWAPRLAPLGEWSSFEGEPPPVARPAPDLSPPAGAGPDPDAPAQPRRPVAGAPTGPAADDAGLEPPPLAPRWPPDVPADPYATAAGAAPATGFTPRLPDAPAPGGLGAGGGGPATPDRPRLPARGFAPPLPEVAPAPGPGGATATASGGVAAGRPHAGPPRSHAGAGFDAAEGAAGLNGADYGATRLDGPGGAALGAPRLDKADGDHLGATRGDSVDGAHLGGAYRIPGAAVGAADATGLDAGPPPWAPAATRLDGPGGWAGDATAVADDRLSSPGGPWGLGPGDEATEALRGGPRATATDDHPGGWGPHRDDARAPATGGFRHRPGIGLLLGLAGLVALTLSFTVLPWAVTGGDEVTFPDIRTAADIADDVTTADVAPAPATTSTLTVGPADPGAVPGATDPAGTAASTGPAGTATTVPGTVPGAPTAPPAGTATTTTVGGMGLVGKPRQAPGDPTATSVPTGGTGIPATTAPTVTASSPAPTVVPGAATATTLPAAAPAASGAMGTLGGDYIEAFTEWGWIAVLALTGVAVLFSTLIVPRSFGGRLLTGFLMAAVIGLLVNAADREGISAPRVTGALVTILAGAGLAGALWQLFGEDAAPSPAWGVWVGVGGATAALLGCLLGTRRQPVEA